MYKSEYFNNLNANKIARLYLMSCYLYYELDLNVFTDDEFNSICKRLVYEFSNITHPHKHLLDIDELTASTGYTLKYSKLIKHAAVSWYEIVNNTNIDKDVLFRGGYNIM